MTRLICPIHALEDCLDAVEAPEGTVVRCTESGFELLPTSEPRPARPSAAVSTVGRQSPASAVDNEAWMQYERWNDAIAKTIFDGRHAGRPVYLDMEAPVLAEIARRVGVDANDEAEHAFIDAIKKTVFLPKRSFLRPHVDRLQQWEVDRPGTPPVLGVLCLFALAAEAMRGDESMAPNNFYGRLLQKLGLDAKHRGPIAAGYRENASDFWGAANSWLSDHDGELGLPTAVEGGTTNRHVFLSISQALLREGDRERLVDMFEHFGLSAGSIIAVSDAARLLGEWASHSHCTFSSTMQRALKKDHVLERVAELVQIELENWDGVSREDLVEAGAVGSARRGGAIKLLASVAGFPSRRLRLGLGVVAAQPEVTHMEVEPEDVQAFGGATRADLRLLADSTFRVDLDAQPRWNELLARHVHARIDGGIEAERPARRLVTLRHDPGLSLYVEAERLQLGEDAVVLAHAAVRGDLEVALSEAARPGWTADTDMPGIPDGWVLFRGVQVLAAPSSSHRDLAGLVPASHAQATFGGGLRLPGRTTRWHRDALPELRVSAIEHERISVSLKLVRGLADGTAQREQLELGEFDSVAAIPLPSRELPEGDYLLEVRETESQVLVLSTTIRVRSGDTLAADKVAGTAPHLGRDVSNSPWALLSATEQFQSESIVGATAPAGIGVDLELVLQLPDGSPWETAEPDEDLAELLDDSGSERSAARCFLTGAHYYVLPTVGRSRTSRATVEGVCQYCGARNFYPTRPVRKGRWAVQRYELEQARHSTADLSTVTEVARAADLDADIIFDGLVHLRDGTGSQLAQVVSAGGDPLRGHWLLRNLEALGHIEVERDATMDPVRWRVTPPTLVGVPGIGAASAFLAGARQTRLLHLLDDLAERSLIKLDRTPQPLAPTRVSVTTDDVGGLRRVVAEARATNLDLVLASAAPLRIAAAAAAISSAAGELPERPMPMRATLQQLQLPQVRWRRVQAAEEPGVYRIDLGYRALHSLRRKEEISSATFRYGPQELVKHIGAQEQGCLLISYVDGNLLTPAKVGLPGLLERAAALCSGLAPEERDGRYLAYRQVPADVAAWIAHRLSS